MSYTIEELVAMHHPHTAMVRRRDYPNVPTVAYYANETFAHSPLYPNYLIGNMGTVYNMKTRMKINPMIDKDGYETIKAMRADGSQTTVGIHRLILQAHAPLQDYTGMCVNHINGHKTQNIYLPGDPRNNMEWATYAENNQHAWRTGLKHAQFGEEAAAAKHTEAQVRTVCELLSQGYTGPQIAAHLGMPYTEQVRSWIKSIKRRDAWPHIINEYQWPAPMKQRSNSPEMVHAICKLITQGYSDKEVSALMMSQYNHDVSYRFVKEIRLGKHWLEIGKQYGFPLRKGPRGHIV